MPNYVKKHYDIISKDSRSKISIRYKKITKSINSEFWNSTSETNNSFYVGSYGRNTAISTSDIDILVLLPSSEFDRFNNLSGNSQSRLLQAVKDTIKLSYPNSDVKADGQVIKINYSDGIKFEILPAFKNYFGSYIYPDSNLGGNWKSTNPKAEQEAMKQKNKESNGLLVATCRHLRYIRDNFYKSYHLSGIVIDSFIYNAIGNWEYVQEGTSSASPGDYEGRLLDYFNEKSILWSNFPLRAPGSEDEVSTDDSIKCLEKVLKYMVE
ncbi:MAG: nucleotidyltransferase domain-containing protein [Anaerococcus sp.]|nr:nucleotidyltransferase domain-containing protein [Anaerococcus sp.]MDY2919180.1 nucleotidyltransferase domain-containing protein [Anaerococcus sp.]